MNPDNIYAHIIYGAPGSGKTTICEKVCDVLGYKYVSIGEITRNEIAQDTDLGRRLKYYLDIPIEYPEGLLGELIIKRFEQFIEENTTFILDGYPKYSWEAVEYLDFLKSHPRLQTGKVILIDISPDVSFQRISRRYLCTSCGYQTAMPSESERLQCSRCSGELRKRVDDTEDFSKQRYLDFQNSIRHTLEQLLENDEQLLTIDGTQEIDEIVEHLKEVFK